MNLTKNTILALGLLAAAGVSNAQTTATNSAAPVGLLGQTYSEVNFGVSDITHYSPNAYSLGVAGNAPVSPFLDLGAGYNYSWIGGADRGHGNTLSGGATLYKTFAGVKPFVGAAVGYQWTTFTYGRDEQAVWGATVGVEIPVSVITLTPRIVYADDFRGANRSQQSTSYEVEANYWVTPKAGVFAGLGYTDVRRSSLDSWDYSVGARFKF
ncbi:MAG TPA: hypothetical protein VHE61_03925 [Opitutaceae bacterium]|nr:hypothetical protein [Opitutaceae bacterium]